MFLSITTMIFFVLWYFAFVLLKADPVYSKNYELHSERAELLFYNDSFVKDVFFHFGKVNRTHMALNASFYIPKDFPNQKLIGSVKCFQFYHNEYRFTGTRVNADTCKIERANIFQMQQQFRDAQFNISLCNIKKGHYKLVNFAPNAKYFPDYLPRGKLRSNVRLHHENGAELFNLNWDFEIRAPQYD